MELCGFQGPIIRSRGLKTNTVVTLLNLGLIFRPQIIRAGPRKPIGLNGYKALSATASRSLWKVSAP